MPPKFGNLLTDALRTQIAETDARFRIIVSHQHRGTLPGRRRAIGYQEQRVHHFVSERNFDSHLLLGDVVPPRCVYDLNAWLFNQRWPRTHHAEPRREDLRAAALPIGGSPDGRPVGKQKGRTEAAQVRPIFLGWLEKLRDPVWRLGKLLLRCRYCVVRFG